MNFNDKRQPILTDLLYLKTYAENMLNRFEGKRENAGEVEHYCELMQLLLNDLKENCKKQ